MSEPYSDLEVARESGLEYYKSPSDGNVGQDETRNGTYKEAYTSNAHPAPAISVHSEPEIKAQATLRRRICGLTPRTFWIVLVVCIVIIAGVVGGGIGGALSNRSSKSTTNSSSTDTDPEEASISNKVSTVSSTQSSMPSAGATKVASSSNTLSTASSTPISTRLSTKPFTSLASNTVAADLITSSASKTSNIISTTTLIGASTTLLNDCPSSNDTLFTTNNSSFRKICSNNYVGNNNLVNQKVNNLDYCISLCDAFNTLNEAAIEVGETEICNAVCWRGTIAGDDLPGDCFGITTTNSSSGFVYGGDVNCNSAALIN